MQKVIARERMNFMKDYGEVPYNLEMVNLGSTFSKYGFDYQYFGKKGFNFAVAPQPLKTDREVLEKYQKHINKNGVVVIVIVCPFGFCVHEYSSLRRPPFQREISWLKRLVKKALRYDRRKQHNLEKDPLSTEELCRINSRSRVNDWKKEFFLKNTTTQLPTKELQKTFVKTRAELAGIITLCKEDGFRPLIINMPAMKEECSQFSNAFIKAFYEDNLGQANMDGVPVIDYFGDERFNDISLYENYADCFNDNGRRLFASVLTEDMKKLGLWEGEE